MIDLDRIESAVSRVEQAKHLIQQARLVRKQAGPPTPSIQDQIETTRRASEASAGLTRLIDGMNDPDDASPRA